MTIKRNIPEWVPLNYKSFVVASQSNQCCDISKMLNSDYQKNLFSELLGFSQLHQKMWDGLSKLVEDLCSTEANTFYICLHLSIEQAWLATRDKTLDASTIKQRITHTEKTIESLRESLNNLNVFKQESPILERIVNCGWEDNIGMKQAVVNSLKAVSVSRPVISQKDCEGISDLIGYLELYLSQLKSSDASVPRQTPSVPTKSFTTESSTTSRYIAVMFDRTFGSPHYGNVANICNVLGFSDISKEKVTQTYTKSAFAKSKPRP